MVCAKVCVTTLDKLGNIVIDGDNDGVGLIVNVVNGDKLYVLIGEIDF